MTKATKDQVYWDPDTETWRTLTEDAAETGQQAALLPPDPERSHAASRLRDGIHSRRERLSHIAAGQRTFPFPLLYLDLHAYHAIRWHTHPLDLGPTQLRIVILLMLRAGQVVSHDDLYQVITQGESIIEPAQVSWHICRIRAEAAQTGHELPIHTVHGRGYILRLPDEHVWLPAVNDADLQAELPATLPESLPDPP